MAGRDRYGRLVTGTYYGRQRTAAGRLWQGISGA